MQGVAAGSMIGAGPLKFAPPSWVSEDLWKQSEARAKEAEVQKQLMDARPGEPMMFARVDEAVFLTRVKWCMEKYLLDVGIPRDVVEHGAGEMMNMMFNNPGRVSLLTKLQLALLGLVGDATAGTVAVRKDKVLEHMKILGGVPRTVTGVLRKKDQPMRAPEHVFGPGVVCKVSVAVRGDQYIDSKYPMANSVIEQAVETLDASTCARLKVKLDVLLSMYKFAFQELAQSQPEVPPGSKPGNEQQKQALRPAFVTLPGKPAPTNRVVCVWGKGPGVKMENERWPQRQSTYRDQDGLDGYRRMVLFFSQVPGPSVAAVGFTFGSGADPWVKQWCKEGDIPSGMRVVLPGDETVDADIHALDVTWQCVVLIAKTETHEFLPPVVLTTPVKFGYVGPVPDMVQAPSALYALVPWYLLYGNRLQWVMVPFETLRRLPIDATVQDMIKEVAGDLVATAEDDDFISPESEEDESGSEKEDGSGSEEEDDEEKGGGSATKKKTSHVSGDSSSSVSTSSSDTSSSSSGSSSGSSSSGSVKPKRGHVAKHVKRAKPVSLKRQRKVDTESVGDVESLGSIAEVEPEGGPREEPDAQCGGGSGNKGSPVSVASKDADKESPRSLKTGPKRPRVVLDD
jgi:hypothetical protein